MGCKEGRDPRADIARLDAEKVPQRRPIPGSKNKERTIENLDAWNVRFTDKEFSELENELDRIPVHGHRGSVQVEGSKMSDWGKD